MLRLIQCNKAKKAVSILFVMILLLGYILANKQYSYAKTTEISTCLLQKSNSSYKSHIKNGISVADKVKLKKKNIIIHGSLCLRDNSTEEKSSIGTYTYNLSDDIKYYRSGGTSPEQELSKKDFQKCLKRNKDSGLGLVLTLRSSKIVKIIITQ